MSENENKETVNNKEDIIEIDANIGAMIAEFKRDLHSKSKNELIRMVIQLYMLTKKQEVVGQQVVDEFNKYIQDHRVCNVSELKRAEEAKKEQSNAEINS